MAVIPRGDFGFAVARPQQGPGTVGAAFDGGQADALARGARMLGDVVDARQAEITREEKIAQAEAKAQARQAAREQEAERKAAAREADRVKSLVARANMQNGMADLYDQVAAGLRDGSIQKDQVFTRWDADSQKLTEAALKDVSPEHRPLVEAEMMGVRGRFKNTLGDAVLKRDQQEVGAGLIQLREANQRAALRDPTKAIADWETTIDALGPKAGMTPDQIVKEKQGFREQVTFTGLERRVTAAGQHAGTLRAIQKELASDKYTDLAPERRNFFEANIERKLLTIAQQGEIAERRRLNAVQMQAQRLGWYIEHGREIPPAEFDRFAKDARGTPFDGMATAMLQEQKAVAELTTLPPERMFARVKEIEAGYGPTPSKEQLTHIARMKNFANNTAKALQESPLQFAMERGGAKVAPLDFSNMATWAENLQSRVGILTEQAQRTGADQRGLLPAEVNGFRQVLNSAPVEQRREILATLRRGFGSEAVYRATLQQIAPDDPVTRAAGIAAARGLTDTGGKVVADYILRGQQALRPDTKRDGQTGKGGLLPMPKDDELGKAFNEVTGNAFAGAEQSRSNFIQTARAIYAAQAIDAGDFSGEYNRKRWESAVALATGGTTKKNGRDILLPYGMDQGKFRDQLVDRTAALAPRLPAGITLERLRDLPMVNDGDGRYIFRAGDGVVVGKDGRPLVVDFNDPLPEAATIPSTHAASMRARMGGNNQRNVLE